MGLDDAAVDAVARPEVVPVDDQALHRAGSTGATSSNHSDQFGQTLEQRVRTRRVAAAATLHTSRLASRA